MINRIILIIPITRINLLNRFLINQIYFHIEMYREKFNKNKEMNIKYFFNSKFKQNNNKIHFKGKKNWMKKTLYLHFNKWNLQILIRKMRKKFNNYNMQIFFINKLLKEVKINQFQIIFKTLIKMTQITKHLFESGLEIYWWTRIYLQSKF